jgi:CO dehydrogenase/acetyl-CoA synthase beta subunit
MSSNFQSVVGETAAALNPDDIENNISTAAQQDMTFIHLCAAIINKPDAAPADFKILEMVREREREREEREREREREREERREVRAHSLAMANLAATRAANGNSPLNEY